MVQAYYISAFVISLICASIYAYMWHKHFDVNFTMVFTLVPLSLLGYLLSSQATTLDGALTATKIIYIGGCFLQLFIFLNIINLCQISIPGWLRMALFMFAAFTYGTVLTIGHTNLFYKYVSFKMIGETGVLTKSYGTFHTLVYAQMFFYLAAGIIVIIYSWFRKIQIPRTIIMMLVVPDALCIISLLVSRKNIYGINHVTTGFVLSEIGFLLIAYRINLYDVSDTVIDSMIQDRGIGYISCDFKLRYLGGNETAMELCPEFKQKTVDEVIGYKPSERKIRHFLDDFRKEESRDTFVYTVRSESEDPDEDRFYNVKVGYLYDGNRKRGYILTFSDDTANRKYIRLLDTYNEKLKSEVEEKTSHIIMMHDNLIMSLAMMVESRDNSTGGHIKRTSEGVRILMDEIIKEGKHPLTDEFCRDVVKAAPMHDLGKIAVDDEILRKPGRFEPEEFEKMKKHAAEGARVIHDILLNTDDNSFKRVAENVAHYHHERWDGSGYPEGLRGKSIPLEARIMAIADVYDALVSKRVYKDAYDFKKADSIIMEGMASQFDPGLKTAYENARPRLEEYYRNQAEAVN
ncbi:MAG: HD domain-containing protein [Lachnospiraceae bacterium]|nr:HD domain-containing protein [Lachnospiraceae bacterium]